MVDELMRLQKENAKLKQLIIKILLVLLENRA